jgi:hypothetical protein
VECKILGLVASLVWVRERPAGMGPHKSCQPCSSVPHRICIIHKPHHGRRSHRAPQPAASSSVTESSHRPLPSRFCVSKFPIEIKKYGGRRSYRNNDETLEERELELYPHKIPRRFVCPRDHLASRYGARRHFYRGYFEEFLQECSH